jgi:hypothetical protein
MKLKMKTLLGSVVVAGCLLSGGQLKAQEQQTVTESGMAPKVGIKGGLNLSNFYNDDINDNNVRVGWNAGFFAKLPVARGFSIQPELLYSNKGSKTTYDNVVQGEGEYRLNMHYVELPVLAVVNLSPNFSLHAGPYIGYLAGANTKNLHSDGSAELVTDYNAENFNRIDYGLAGGLGVDIQNVTVGARYNLGLQEVGKSGSVIGESLKGVKNNNISIYVGVGF